MICALFWIDTLTVYYVFLLADVETSILNAFLSDIEHAPIHINATNKELEGFMRSEMETRGFACLQLERTLHLAASLIEV